MLNAPVIWILFPGSAALILFFLRRFRRFVLAASVLICLLLALLAWQLPIGETLDMLPGSLAALEIEPVLNLLGRRLILIDSSRSFLTFFYLITAFWLGGALPARPTAMFVPLGLGITAVLTAALAVVPLLYAALLIGMAAFLSVPILSPPGAPVGRGVMRFLTFQTLGISLILLAGWLLEGAGTIPGNPVVANRVFWLAGLGFGLTIAIFPFHTWVTMVSEESQPYSAAFVWFMIPGVTTLFALRFLGSYPWIQNSETYSGLLIIGSLMVFLGGFWAAFQRHLGRIFGYAVIAQIGMALLATSLQFQTPEPGQLSAQETAGIFFALYLPRAISTALWALALVGLRQERDDLRFQSVQGVAFKKPVTTLALVVSHLSLAGFPLLAGFPVLFGLWIQLAITSPLAALVALAGSGALLAAGVRSLAVLVTGQEEQRQERSETRLQASMFVIASLILLLLGLAPQLYLPLLAQIQIF